MIPNTTHELIKDKRVRTFDDGDYALSDTDMRDLAALAVRLESKMVDANELRDWQNRLNLMLSQAQQL